jgi:catechol 2,3-dioxygenase-like lactoylglutathione lyase family enzyme
MAVGSFRATVVDVNDLERGERFWSSVLGLPVIFHAWQGQFSRLGTMGPGSVLLQLVPETKTDLKNRAHIDVTVADVHHAVEEVISLGGSLIRGPALYPENDPLLDHAVVADPFGNEFCLIRDVRQA